MNALLQITQPKFQSLENQQKLKIRQQSVIQFQVDKHIVLKDTYSEH